MDNQTQTIMVPFSKDGSYFHPGLRTQDRNYYQVGDKDDAKRFETFEEALKYLNEMKVAKKTPKWRRPNENGNWGLVSAVKWDVLPSSG